MNKPGTLTISLDLVRRLRGVGTRSIQHVGADCPTWIDPSAIAQRDPACPACQVLCEADAAIERAESHAGDEPCPPAILKRRGMLSAPELAAVAGSDVKTVHNHAKAGKLQAGQTAGKQLRFTARAARGYVQIQGRSVPSWLEALAAGEGS